MRIMVFWAITKVRIFIPLTLFWVLLGGLTGCTTLRGGLITEADLGVSSDSGLENLSFDTIQQMNQRATSLSFEGSIFVSTPRGTERSRVNVILSEKLATFTLQGRMGLGKTEIKCGYEIDMNVDPPQDLVPKEQKMLDVLCRSIYPLSTLSTQYVWRLLNQEHPEEWAATTQTDVEGESFLWTLERFNQSNGLVLPQKITLQHASDPFRVQMLLKATHLEAMTTPFQGS